MANKKDSQKNAKPQVAESGKLEHEVLLQIKGTLNACHEEAGHGCGVVLCYVSLCCVRSVHAV